MTFKSMLEQVIRNNVERIVNTRYMRCSHLVDSMDGLMIWNDSDYNVTCFDVEELTSIDIETGRKTLHTSVGGYMDEYGDVHITSCRIGKVTDGDCKIIMGERMRKYTFDGIVPTIESDNQ